MRDDYTEWERYTHPDPDEGDPPTLEEQQIVREFVERYSTSDPIPVHEAAQRLMSLINEDRVMEERKDIVAETGEVVDKGNRVSYFLWDVGIDMPRYQVPVIKLVEAIRALPELERSEEQIRAGLFEDKMEDWKTLEKFRYVWHTTFMLHVWSMRRGPYPFYGCWEYQNAYGFWANHLAIFPPESQGKGSHELTMALRVTMLALEQDPWNHVDPLARRTDNATDNIQVLNSDVHGMVPFFEISGQVIFSFIGKYDFSFLEPLKVPGCSLWTADSSFTRERWEFWKTRLQWVSEQDELMERTRDDARNIIRLMREIEQQTQR